MLATLIQRYDKPTPPPPHTHTHTHNILFLIQFKNERQTKILQALRCHILWSYWYYVSNYLTFLRYKKSIFEDMEPLMPAQRHLGSLSISRAPAEDSDQTLRMRRLIWVFTGLACPDVQFLALRRIFSSFRLISIFTNWICKLRRRDKVTLRKQAYSNILKILPPKNVSFQI